MKGHLWCYLVAAVCLALANAEPSAKLTKPKKPIEERRPRDVSKYEGEYRDCDAVPPYLPPTAIETGERLKNLRTEMTALGLSAYLVPPGDSHQSEYIALRDKRRQYISGFTGSAGLAIVTTDMAALWTDGRYYLQADMQLDCNWILMKEEEAGTPTPEDWLVEVLSDGDQVGFDPTIMSISKYYMNCEYDSYNSTFEAADGGNPVLVSVVGNLVDIVWGADAETPQPDYPDEPLLILDWEKYTGETWQQKIWEYDGSNGLDSIRSKLNEASADAIVVSKLDEVAWLFNLRGKDVPSNPMFFSYAIIKLDAIYLYLYDKDGRLVNDVKTHLGIGTGACVDETTEAPECVTVRDYSKFLGDLETLSEDRIWISDQMSYAIYDRVPATVRYLMASPVLHMKAVKSPKEIEGMNNAHFKDSIVLCELGAWLQETMDELEDPAVGDIEVLSELIVADKAMKLREAMPDNEGLSFGAISAFGPNGAVIHYKSTEESNVPITNQGTFLFDSGSQYLDGTVDITQEKRKRKDEFEEDEHGEHREKNKVENIWKRRREKKDKNKKTTEKNKRERGRRKTKKRRGELEGRRNGTLY
ncbi:xaa-Pro aminopeptidase 1-like [Amphiura filiformis]|uniref:xaa-Pro aminopeptidase 1-like n=1 Tax=Amphiura filiformis TaxID=82378 RepID=UPI003B20F026